MDSTAQASNNLPPGKNKDINPFLPTTQEIETATATTFFDLPYEVLAIILGMLPQADLYKARLASRLFSKVGRRLYLFETIYLAPREKRLKRFDYICQHPIFRKTVKSIVFDCRRFCPGYAESKQDYIQAVLSQYDWRVPPPRGVRVTDKAQLAGDLSLLNELVDRIRTILMRDVDVHEALDYSWRCYVGHCQKQESLTAGGEVLKSLRTNLKHMPQVKSFMFELKFEGLDILPNGDLCNQYEIYNRSCQLELGGSIIPDSWSEIDEDALMFPYYEIFNIAVEAGIRLDELSLGRYVFHQQKETLDLILDDSDIRLRTLLQNLRKIDLNGKNVNCGARDFSWWTNGAHLHEWRSCLRKMLKSSVTLEEVTLRFLSQDTLSTIAQYTWPSLRRLKLDYLEVNDDNFDDICSLCKQSLEVLALDRVIMHTALWRRFSSFLVSNCRLKSVQAIFIKKEYGGELKYYAGLPEQTLTSMLAPQVGEEIITETANQVHCSTKASIVRKSM